MLPHSPNRVPLVTGLIAGVLCFAVVSTVSVLGIRHSGSSTAAIGFLFMPMYSTLFGAAGFACGWLFGVLLPRTETARLRVLRLAAACVIAALSCLLAGSALWNWYTVRDTVIPVGDMNPDGLEALLENHKLGQNKFVLGAIAESPRATASILHRIAALNRPDLCEPLRSFLPVPSRNGKGIAVMRLVALNPNTSPPDLNYLAEKWQDDYLLGDLARRAGVSEVTLRRLAERGNYLVDWGLSANPEAPKDLLLSLSARSNEYTRSGVAANPSAPYAALLALSRDPIPHVRAGVAMNPSAAADIVESLLKDPDVNVRRAAAARHR